MGVEGGKGELPGDTDWKGRAEDVGVGRPLEEGGGVDDEEPTPGLHATAAEEAGR